MFHLFLILGHWRYCWKCCSGTFWCTKTRNISIPSSSTNCFHLLQLAEASVIQKEKCSEG